MSSHPKRRTRNMKYLTGEGRKILKGIAFKNGSMSNFGSFDIKPYRNRLRDRFYQLAYKYKMMELTDKKVDKFKKKLKEYTKTSAPVYLKMLND